MENTYPNFNFQWLALWKDGSLLSQFKKEGGENLFRPVLEDQENIKQASVVGLKDKKFEGNKFTVDLERGVLITECAGEASREFALADKILLEAWERPVYRLIYFRRNVQEFKGTGEKSGPQRIIHVLGFQTTIAEKNYKLCFAIDNDDGTWFRTDNPEAIQI